MNNPDGHEPEGHKRNETMNDPRPVKPTFWLFVKGFYIANTKVTWFVVLGVVAAAAWVWYERIYGPF